MAKKQLEWVVVLGSKPGVYYAELWDRPFNGVLIAETRMTTSKSQATKDGRIAFAGHKELR